MNGTPTVYEDGFLGFYITGTDTETDTYSNSTLATPNLNPVELDENGQAETAIFLDPNVVYKVVLYDKNMIAVKTADPVADPAANVTVAFNIVAGNPNGQSAGNQGSIGGSGASVVWDVVNNLVWVCTTTGSDVTAVWTQVGAALSGVLLKTGFITPATLAANTDNYDPAGNNTASEIRQDLSGDYALYGLVATGSGEIKTIFNISTANTLTFVDGTVISSSTAANRFALGGKSITLYPGQSITLIYDGISARWREEGQHPMLALPVPGGRLCLVTAEPVHAADKTAITSVFYTPYLHGFIPLWGGTHFYVMPFSELTQTLADSTKSPLAAAASTLYDLFVWNDAGTLRLSRGPAWTNATSRSAGTALVRKGGLLVNNASISNGPVANFGTYVGTISTSATGANGQLNMMFAPTPAAGGTANRLDVWNMYNRRPVIALVRDSTDTWDYATATWRAANAAAASGVANRVTLVAGLNEDPVEAAYHAAVLTSATRTTQVGIGLDSTTAPAALPTTLNINNNNAATPLSGWYAGYVGIGSHFIQELERGDGAATIRWHGDNADATNFQTGMIVKWTM